LLAQLDRRCYADRYEAHDADDDNHPQDAFPVRHGVLLAASVQ
jgi:hypothetical protein